MILYTYANLLCLRTIPLKMLKNSLSTLVHQMKAEKQF